MMSAGLIGSQGLGYFKDRYAAEELKTADATVYEDWKGEGDASSFLGFEEVQAIDAQRLEEAKKVAKDERSEIQATVVEADIRGNRRTLVTDSFIPAAMAVIYLLLIFYFKATGGYRPVKIDE